MNRFFVPPQVIRDDAVVLRGPLVHQLRDVLRQAPGDSIVLLDDTGWAFRTELAAVERESVRGRITEKWLVESEPKTRITLYQGLVKGQKLEWVLQKGTELGIAAFVPVLASRSVMGRVDDVSASRFERWQRIVVEAAEQSGRGRLPSLVRPIPFDEACQRAAHADLAIIPWEEEREHHLRQVLLEARSPRDVHLLVGPEGGFEASEIATAEGLGVRPVTLGPRILRAETAGLVAAAAILYALGDFG